MRTFDEAIEKMRMIPIKNFEEWMDSKEEREKWSGNYNNATRDEFVARRAWDYQQKEIDRLEKSLKELSAFCSDFQMFAHTHLVCTKDRKYYTFQDMRKAAYTMRKEEGHEPEWGDSGYFNEEFKGLSTLEKQNDILRECAVKYSIAANWKSRILGVADITHEEDLEQLECTKGLEWNTGGKWAREALAKLEAMEKENES